MPGCPELVRQGARCTDHDRAYRAEIDSLRPSAARRGYDALWRRVRIAHLRRHPSCAVCRSGLRLEVDHIDGDVTNLAPANLRTLCKSCHSRRTARDQGFARPRPGGTAR